MPHMKKEEQGRLITDLCNLGAGQAEAEDRKRFIARFHPVPDHARAFDPSVVLVLGDRGTGKTELFRSVFRYDLLRSLAHHSPNVHLDPLLEREIAWIPAYPVGPDFPDTLGLRDYFSRAGNTIEGTIDLWMAYLVRVLATKLQGSGFEELKTLIKLPAADPVAVVDRFRELKVAPTICLDRLDARLLQEDRYLFVGYDELDTLGGYNWPIMERAVNGLVGFWATYSRRWKRLRPKIFIRTDLFRRHTGLGGADYAKLSANRAELTWSDRNLYAMILKRVANTSKHLLRYCQAARIAFIDDEELGQVPRVDAIEREGREFMTRLVGPFMGANINKGKTWTWVLDHLRDGQRRVAPRSMAVLIEKAAAKEREKPRSRPPRLLHPIALRQALAEVSKEHVRQAESEWPWLPGLHERIGKQQVPMDKKEMIQMLKRDWDASWGSSIEIHPPVQSANELVDYHVELGLFRERAGDAIDVPDLFLFGLELKRRGGVKKD